jgi:prepilin-type N-terminal cleavage/methylation domain-containing protein
VTTSRPRRRAANGFTLVEVLAAFMILSIGLLALEALAIGASRMVARSERLGEYTTEAMSTLEETLSEIRMGFDPGAGSVALQGATMYVTPNAADGGRYWTVTVTVRPTADRILAATDSFSVSGYAFVEP